MSHGAGHVGGRSLCVLRPGGTLAVAAVRARIGVPGGRGIPMISVSAGASSAVVGS